MAEALSGTAPAGPRSHDQAAHRRGTALLIVVDASVTLAWLLADESSGYADAVLGRLATEDAIVPHVWGLEVANALLVAERRGRIREDETPAVVDRLLSLPIAMDPIARDRAMTATLALARRHGLSSYDAAYLELATRLRVPLATLDESLARAADATGAGHWQAPT